MELYNNKGDFQLEMVKDRSKVNVTFNFEMFIDENNEFKIKIWSNKYKKFNYEERLTSDLMHCILFNKCDFNKYKSYYTNYKYKNVDINNINDLIKCNYEYDIYEEWDEVYKPKTILIDKKVELIDGKHMIKLTFIRKNDNITINIPTAFILLNKNFIKKYFKDRFNDIVIDNIECKLNTIFSYEYYNNECVTNFDYMILLFKIDDNLIFEYKIDIDDFINFIGSILDEQYFIEDSCVIESICKLDSFNKWITPILNELKTNSIDRIIRNTSIGKYNYFNNWNDIENCELVCYYNDDYTPYYKSLICGQSKLKIYIKDIKFIGVDYDIIITLELEYISDEVKRSYIKNISFEEFKKIIDVDNNHVRFKKSYIESISNKIKWITEGKIKNVLIENDYGEKIEIKLNESVNNISKEEKITYIYDYTKSINKINPTEIEIIFNYKTKDNIIGSATQRIKVNVGDDIINKVYNFLHNNNFFEIIKN